VALLAGLAFPFGTDVALPPSVYVRDLARPYVESQSDDETSMGATATNPQAAVVSEHPVFEPRASLDDRASVSTSPKPSVSPTDP
jgi:hypothetical protein